MRLACGNVYHLSNDYKYTTGICAACRCTVRIKNGIGQYSDVIMTAMASQINSVLIVYSYSGADQRKYQKPSPLAFVRGIHRWPVNSPHKGPVTQKMFPFDDVIMHVPVDNPPDSWLRCRQGRESTHGNGVPSGSLQNGLSISILTVYFVAIKCTIGSTCWQSILEEIL